MSQQITTKARTPWLPLAAAGVTVLLWASAFVAIRDATPHFSPGALALGRLVVGSITLGVMLLIRREGVPPRAAWPGIVATGLLWFGLYMIALNWGERSVDAGTAAMVVATGPIVIALLSGWLLKEGFPPRLLAGIAVAFTGAGVVGYSVSGGSRSSTLGVLLCLVAAVSFASAMVSEKPALRHASALQVTTFACLVGAIACLPFSGQLASQLAKAPGSATLNMVYLGLFPTAIAFGTWSYALARTTAGKLGATTLIIPAVAVLLSWAFLGEIPTWLTFVGGVLCVLGVAITRSRARSRSGPITNPRSSTAAEPTEPGRSAGSAEPGPSPASLAKHE
jgi:drug/metabolite transporter (DMT)-like permease